MLVARVSGRSFDDYLAERILEPLGMLDTGFSFPPGEVARATTAYRRGVLEAFWAAAATHHSHHH